MLPWMLLAAALAVRAGKPPDKPDADAAPQAGEALHGAASGKATPLSLTASQQQAVGIRVDRPLPLNGVPQIQAYGTVLDPSTLVTDAGRVASTRAAAAAASADAERLERLYHEDMQASLKAWQASQAQSVEAAAQARSAEIGFRQQWGPLATWSAAQRQALLQTLSEGKQVLLRADVPGHSVASTLDPHALVEVDGMNVAARVLGPLPRTDAQTQSAGWLLAVEHGPAGLGPGTRAAVQLHAAAVAGLMVPASALLYAEQGAYVYRQESSGGDTFHYTAVPVRPLTRIGSAWLVAGLSRADQIVVQGAGVLWSLQGISSFSAAEEEHD
jgi:hypothetical protein